MLSIKKNSIMPVAHITNLPVSLKAINSSFINRSIIHKSFRNHEL